MQMKCSRIPRDYLKLAAAALYFDAALAGLTVGQSEGWERDGDHINRSVSTWDDRRTDGQEERAVFWRTCIIRTVFRVFIVFLLLPLLMLFAPFLLPSFPSLFCVNTHSPIVVLILIC